MRPISVVILLPPASAADDSPEAWLHRGRRLVAEHHRAAFDSMGVADVRILTQPDVGRPFGARLRDLARGCDGGLVVVSGGAMPLATPEDLEQFVRAARSSGPSASALANSFHSADVVAISDARILLGVPDLPSDNALPRWLAERARIPVDDLRDRPWLATDIDSPLDVLLVASDPRCPEALRALAGEIARVNPRLVSALKGVGAVLADPRAQLLVAGRTSSTTLLWLERNARCRVRALVEERGLRASSPMAAADQGAGGTPFRPPRSLLGMLLDDRGPDALATIARELADAGVIDTRVLLAHRLGGDEGGWPRLADRLASDLLRPDGIADDWLRALTGAALDAEIPIVLGGHTLVGPALHLIASNAAAAGAI